MRLWSYQSPAFSLIDGKVDAKQSEFTQCYLAAYQRLWNCIGTDQLIWCRTSRDVWHRETGTREWELEVPKDRFLRIVDSMVWEGVLGNHCFPRPPLRSELKQAALNHFPHSLEKRDAWYEKQVEDMLHPPGDPWDALFLSDPNDLKADVLLRHPIERHWVISSREIP